MVTIPQLWMPILSSSVLVFVASFLVWMVLPHHRSDWKKLPDEEAARKALRAVKEPGQYLVPYASSSKEMQSPEHLKKCEEGPVGILTLRKPGPPAMGGAIVLSFLYYVVVSIAVAYVTGRTVAPDAHYLAVFRVAGTVAMLTYSGAYFPASIWFGRPWSVTIKEVVDGIAYGLLTAGAFGWLWPR
jgi:hypothetical protein